MPVPASKTLTVSQLTAMIAFALGTKPELQNVLVEGELSNLREVNGNWYFVLKDQGATLACICWSQYSATVRFALENGMQLLAHGHIEVYKQRGQHQLYVDRLEPAGVGALALQVRQLADRLSKEGLFDQSRKRALVAVPKRVAVVTSPSAAALRDVCRVLSRRAPYVDIVVVPTVVQGTQAGQQIAAAIARAQTIPGIETIMLVRGGGSYEDLLPFQSEEVAREVVKSRIPVITGIGHETDTSIADLAADKVAPTPSAAAEMVAAPMEALAGEIDRLSSRVQYLFQQILIAKKNKLLAERRALVVQSPLARITRMRESIFGQRQKLDATLKFQLYRLRSQLDSEARSLSAHSPKATLERGYALIENQVGTVVARMSSVAVGDKLTLRMFDGKARVAVMEVESDAG